MLHWLLFKITSILLYKNSARLRTFTALLIISSFSFTQSAHSTIHYSSSLLRILPIDAPPSCVLTRISKDSLSSDDLVATYKYSGFGGLEVACWPLVPKFAEAVGFLRVNKNPQHVGGTWMFVCCDCCVLSGRGLCDELITRSEESYRQWCVVECDLETS